MNGTRRVLDGLVLETRVEYGSAARRNRGRYAGKKVHRLWSEYVVGLEGPDAPRPGTVGAVFARTGKPVLFSCYPACGCTQGQHAGRPSPTRTEADLTCAKCRPTV